MEHNELRPSWVKNEGTGNANDIDSLSQRREAIQSFMNNPERTVDMFPQLGQDLIIFFSQSTNPHMNDTTGEPINGHEVDFDRWEAIRRWAREHLGRLGRP